MFFWRFLSFFLYEFVCFLLVLFIFRFSFFSFLFSIFICISLFLLHFFFFFSLQTIYGNSFALLYCHTIENRLKNQFSWTVSWFTPSRQHRSFLLCVFNAQAAHIFNSPIVAAEIEHCSLSAHKRSAKTFYSILVLTTIAILL